jgi:hypothetical protein
LVVSSIPIHQVILRQNYMKQIKKPKGFFRPSEGAGFQLRERTATSVSMYEDLLLPGIDACKSMDATIFFVHKHRMITPCSFSNVLSLSGYKNTILDLC